MSYLFPILLDLTWLLDSSNATITFALFCFMQLYTFHFSRSRMPVMRRVGFSVIAIAVLICLSVFSLVSIGEGFRMVVNRRDGLAIKKRNGSTITFDIPWKPFSVEVKSISSDLSGLLGAVSNVAAAILDNGSNISNNVASIATTPTSTVPVISSATLSSLGRGSSTLQKLSVDTNIGNVVDAATSLVGMILATASDASNLGVLSYLAASSTTAKSSSLTIATLMLTTSSPQATSSTQTASSPQAFTPQNASCTTCNIPTPSSSMGNVMPTAGTSINTLSANLSSAAMPIVASCPSMTKTTQTFTITSSCPVPSTETCTVTETWYSTRYAETATLFSFMDVLTVTSTETLSICSSSLAGYQFLANSTAPYTPSNMTSQAPDYAYTSAPYATSPLNSVAAITSTSMPPEMLSFTANPPALPTGSLAPTVGADSGLLNDKLGAASSLLAFGAAPGSSLSKYTGTGGSGASLTGTAGNTALANVASALSNMFSGSILSSVMADVNSAMELASSTTTPGSIALDATGLTAKFLPTITNLLNGGVGKSVPTNAAQISNLSATFPPANVATPSRGAGTLSSASQDISDDPNVISQLPTVINGKSTTLPIVSTTLNDQTTALPVINTVVNGVSTNLPILNSPVGQLAGSINQGEARRRNMRRGEKVNVWHEATFCEGLPDHESCA